VALKYGFARRAQSCAILLQALLNSTVIAQILSTEPGGVARAGLLLLRRTLMGLGGCSRNCGGDKEKRQ